MFKLLRNKKAQSTAEYAILIGIVIAAVIGMQTWVSRSLKARIHDAVSNAPAIATQAGETWPTWLTTNQYEPPVPSTSSTVRTIPIRESRTTNNEILREIVGGEVTNRVGSVNYTP
jgi:uncharacterized protein (UPF0333 family)